MTTNDKLREAMELLNKINTMPLSDDDSGRIVQARVKLREALAASKQEPQAKPASEADMKVYSAIASNYFKDSSKQEPQAQAGEPEVVAIVEDDFISECGEEAMPTGTELITLQAHREAMAAALVEMASVSAKVLAKKDAALDACALPKSCVSSTLASDPTGGASILFCFSHIKDAEAWHAVITKAQEARNPNCKCGTGAYCPSHDMP